MSFLNPVNEPVLRFKSTDEGAPQINYAARTSGDVKAVLKACLVDGYGAIASAGWAATNEVGNVIEFVSPSVDMSDYRLGVDDASASSTTWYYQYQNSRVNPSENTPNKSLSYTNLTSPNNGWQLLVTDLGVFFVEILESSHGSSVVTRITYWGKLKSALSDGAGVNIAFWSVGYGARILPNDFFAPLNNQNRHFRLKNHSAVTFGAANINAFVARDKLYNEGAVDLIDELYLYSETVLVAKHPAILLKDTNKITDMYGVHDTTIDSRPVLSVCISAEASSIVSLNGIARNILIYLDTWGY